mgnify:CR=1 FL=1
MANGTKWTKKDLLSRPIEHIDITKIDARPIVDAYRDMAYTSRTLAQAAVAYEWAAERGQTLHAAVYLAVDAEKLLRRLLHRATTDGRPADNAPPIPHRLAALPHTTAPQAPAHRGGQRL